MQKKPKFGESFPNQQQLDIDYEKDQYEKAVDKLAEDEVKKMKFFQPIQHTDFSQRRMFFDSNTEIIGRIFIILAQVLMIGMSYFIGKFVLLSLVSEIVDTSSVQIFPGLLLQDLLGIILLILTALGSLLYIIPMLAIKTAGAVYTWSVSYIILGILSFLSLQLLCSIFLFVASLSAALGGLQITPFVPGMMVGILIITIIQITGAALLVGKSDDVKKKISLEV
ncbi:hypothetical protein NPX79_01095 [Spiroplasma endosymbiont of Anurida maritima]|uniref:hypothetical protein n=1 Tax=Spiroplasma endosymbiont of Anurida maritima TaxID=2967972 RepID=UPI0036D372E2